MKKLSILLISYYFPPYNSVGAVRPGKLAKYFIDSGHNIEVVSCETNYLPLGMTLTIPEKNLHSLPSFSIHTLVQLLMNKPKSENILYPKRTTILGPFIQFLKKTYKTLFNWPDLERSWVKPAMISSRSILSSRSFDIIYVSGPPFSSFTVAKKLSREFNIPWIAEYRDLWSDNHAFQGPKWKKNILSWMEERAIRTCSAIVSVSEPLCKKLIKFKKPVWEIRNGYDPDENLSNNVLQYESDKILKIIYTGSIYETFYDTDILCRALSVIKNQYLNIKIEVYGRNIASLQFQARKYNVDDIFHFSGPISRETVLSKQKISDILLLFLWNSEENGIYTTKLYEYAATRRPILAIGPHSSDVADIVRNSKLGIVAESESEVISAISNWCSKKISGGSIPYQNPTNLDDFNRNVQFSKLENNILNLLSNKI